MASAVAVEASSSAPRLPNNLSDDDEDFTGKVGPIDSEDEVTPRDTVEENGLENEDEDEDEDDLFGDGGDDEDGDQPAKRMLDDEDLDSGDDEGRTDRVPEENEDAVEEEDQQQQTFNFMDADIARHPIPEPSDGELYLFKVPRFLSIEPTAFNHKTFQAPTTDHHSKEAPSEHFSPFETALTTIRWRRSPSNPSELQSNARLVRYSDGSLTLQFASNPLEQYEVNANMLAPPQVNPKKPTPTSIMHKTGQEYKHGYTYLAAPYEEANVMRVTNKFTTGLSVVPAATSKDGALEMLQNALAKAATRGRDSKDQAISFLDVKEDPELQRQKEELQFKERQRAARQKEKVEMRERERQGRALGRSGARSTGYGYGGGDDDGMERRGGAKKPRAKGHHRDWSDDEDYGIRGKTKEDEYDEEDDFIAASDEEPEIVDDDEDDDDGIMESPPRRGRDTQSPKRNRGGDDSDEEVVVNRTKRRRVVEDDDEDE